MSAASRVQIVLVDTDLDASTSVSAQGALTELCASPASRWVLLMISATSFVDLRGLDMLCAARDRCLQSGGTLIIVAPPCPLARMVEVLGLRDELLMVDTLWDAVVLAQTAEAVNDVLPCAAVLGPRSR